MMEHVVHLVAKDSGNAFVLLRFQRGAASCLAHFSEKNFFIGDTTQITDQSEFLQCPYGPFGGVEVGPFDAVAVVVLELVVVIVVALTKGEEGHQGAVPGAAAAGIGPVAHSVTD